jgi:hypothetical protein
LAITIWLCRPKVNQARTILRMKTIAGFNPVNENIIRNTKLIQLARHTELQTLAGIAQTAEIRAENPICRYIRIASETSDVSVNMFLFRSSLL